jgi:hypothetical protein
MWITGQTAHLFLDRLRSVRGCRGSWLDGRNKSLPGLFQLCVLQIDSMGSITRDADNVDDILDRVFGDLALLWVFTVRRG